MKKLSFLFVVVAAMFLFNTAAQAQFNPYAESAKMLTAGIGVSGWGVPIFARFELPVANNFTVGGQVSYQSYSRYGLSGFSLIGIAARGSYHFNEVFEIDNDQWDIYGGASLGFFIYDHPNDWVGNSSTSELGLGIHIGGRYFFNDNLGLNLEIGSGSITTSTTLGLTFVF